MYNRADIMKLAHSIAKKIRSKVHSYKEALARGLKEAWAVAKGLAPLVEDVRVVQRDRTESWVHELVGNTNVEAKRGCA